jgi:hypothetical protein
MQLNKATMDTFSKPQIPPWSITIVIVSFRPIPSTSLHTPTMRFETWKALTALDGTNPTNSTRIRVKIMTLTLGQFWLLSLLKVLM